MKLKKGMIVMFLDTKRNDKRGIIGKQGIVMMIDKELENPIVIKYMAKGKAQIDTFRLKHIEIVSEL